MMDAVERERLDVLAGTRGQSSRQGAAVRRRDLSPLVPLPAVASIKAVSGAITVDQYNALRDDIMAVRRVLELVGQRVKP